MNRRSFIRAAIGAAAAGFVVPEIVEPERKVFALDHTMLNGHHTRYLQWHIDRGIAIPRGYYTIDAPLIVRPYSKGIILEDSWVVGDGIDSLLTFQRSMGDHDRIISNVFQNGEWKVPMMPAGMSPVLIRITHPGPGEYDFGGSLFDIGESSWTLDRVVPYGNLSYES